MRIQAPGTAEKLKEKEKATFGVEYTSALKCAALRRVREDMDLTNVLIMMPFCLRVEEAQRVLDALATGS